MDERRPDPDQLLAAVQRQETSQNRGKLKIFLGMAAGVGKTYAMLETARQLKDAGIDVAVGMVETHGRAETQALLEQLEVIPRQEVEYHGTILREMDLDAILARQPQLVLVDELAHTNAPGSRHLKRYQDVLEILEAGIDVYTTVNVQHFESRSDAVQQITGIRVHETVPDTLIEAADEIELIDLSPEDLRKRLFEGKVYTAERVEIAANNFFRLGNLTALREMALRLTAERVDHQLQDYMQVKHIPGPWKSSERLMVAVSPAQFSERLIRWTRRMAYSLEASWVAVHVESSRQLSDSEKEGVARNLALARRLGAEVVITSGENIADTLIRLAHQRNITQIVVGKPQRSRWDEFFRGSLVDRIIHSSGDIDIYVITGDEPAHPRLAKTPQSGLRTHSNWRAYFISTAVVALITLINYLLLPYIGYQAVGLIELFAVLLIAVFLGRGPALLAATLSALSWNFLFIEPRFTFEINRAHDIILFLLYFGIAAIAGNLTARIRDQEKRARAYAERTMALYTLTHEISQALNMDEMLHTAVEQMGFAFDSDIAIILAESRGLHPSAHSVSTLRLSEKEYSVAFWVFENGKPAGRFTGTLPMSDAYYIPLQTPNRTVGVLGIKPRQDVRFSADQEILIETFVSQVALMIEREMLDESAEQAVMLRESENLYNTLLNSISHEMRTPIATINGAASSLKDESTFANPAIRNLLIQDIRNSAERLNRLVENLLDMSRLESGRLKLKLEWCDAGDVIGVAVKQMEKSLGKRPLTIRHNHKTQLVQMDFVLIEQVLLNLLENACLYTPADTPIEIQTEMTPEKLAITVTDHGMGIPDEAVEHIFEKFYRIPGSPSGGTGLGLSVSRGVVEAHGGQLKVENVRGAGARFIILLPATKPPPVKEAGI
jgi:two-component system, OmpR family, sensor histidine kinase KdpD